MLKTAKKQNVSSTKIYDLLIGLGADKKKAEFAIGEFVKDILILMLIILMTVMYKI